MIKIYIGHVRNFDYKNQIYASLKSSSLWQQHTFILPHDESASPHNTKEIITRCDLIAVEVSYSSTGLGIELGWAECAEREILFFHRKEITPSTSLKILSDNFVAYTDVQEFILNLSARLDHVK